MLRTRTAARAVTRPHGGRRAAALVARTRALPPRRAAFARPRVAACAAAAAAGPEFTAEAAAAGRGLAWLLAGAAALALLARCVAFVPASHAGVVDLLGSVSPDTLPAGIHAKNPLARVHVFSLRTQKVQTELSCPSMEGLPVQVEGVVLYHIDPGCALDMYLRVGADWQNVALEPRVNSAVRHVTSSHEAKDLYDGAHRQTMQAELQRVLQETLTQHGVTVEACLLKNVTLPQSVTRQIEESQRMQHVIEKERQEAQRKGIEAQGIADFQRIVAEGVSKDLLQWKGIEATAELAKSSNSKVVMIGNARDGLPLILGGVNN